MNRQRVRRAPVGDLHVLVALRHGDMWVLKHPSDRRAVKRLARAGLVQAVDDGSCARIANRGEAKLRELALKLYSGDE